MEEDIEYLLCSRKYYEQENKLVKDSTIVTSPSVVPDVQSLDVSLPISLFVNVDCSNLESPRKQGLLVLVLLLNVIYLNMHFTYF